MSATHVDRFLPNGCPTVPPASLSSGHSLLSKVQASSSEAAKATHLPGLELDNLFP
jgi:hypothetical protein